MTDDELRDYLERHTLVGASERFTREWRTFWLTVWHELLRLVRRARA